jgi:hypothetical protein
MEDTQLKQSRSSYLASNRMTSFRLQALTEINAVQNRINECKRLGITAASIAEKTGLPYMTVYRFWTDNATSPSYDAVRTLELYLNSITI